MSGHDREPVRLTSPANAWAVGAQVISVLIPTLAVLELYQPVALEAWGQGVADTWQSVLFVTAIIAVAATLLMSRAVGSGDRVRYVLRVEALATSLVSICYLLLWVALIVEYGLGANPLTQLIVGGLGATAAGRVVQILVDLRKARRAAVADAQVEARAQPKGT